MKGTNMKRPQGRSEGIFRTLAGLKIIMLVGALGAIGLIAGLLALAPTQGPTVEATPVAAPFEATAMSANGVVGDNEQFDS